MITMDNKEKYCEVTFQGKITHEDYEEFIPKVEAYVADHGEISILANIGDLQGWEIRAGIDDMKLAFKYRNSIKKIAVLGDKKWEEYSAKIGDFFMKGQIHYFDLSDNDKAIAWLEES